VSGRARTGLAQAWLVAQPARVVGALQSAYYLVTGIWPLVSLRTFERITGPKIDDWLVRTVGVLAATIGAVIGLRSVGARSEPDPLLGVGSALAFAAVDTRYATTGRISKIYLADAAVELVIAAAWLLAARSTSRQEAR
jgi:hypothetical protein